MEKCAKARKLSTDEIGLSPGEPFEVDNDWPPQHSECGLIDHGGPARLRDHGTPGRYRYLPEWVLREREASMPPRYAHVLLEELIERMKSAEPSTHLNLKRLQFLGVSVEGYLMPNSRQTGYELHAERDPASPHIAVRLESNEFRSDLAGKARVTGYVHGDKSKYLAAKHVRTASGSVYSAGGL